jgi:CubicO group peptidase (beta-lactamase class C family)
MSDLTTIISQAAVKESFSGVVAIYQGNKALYRGAFGYADIANKRKNNLRTKFAIASGTKFFTALGIGTLIDDGKLSLDTTIERILGPGLTFIDPSATIAHLLTHTSGNYDYYDEDMDIDPENYFVEIPWSHLETPADYLPLFLGKQPKYAPGARFSYSNGGFILAGIIIEKITGKLYRDYIRERVFIPAGMKDSGYYAFNRLPANTAWGYKKNINRGIETNIYNLPLRGGSDGGAYTTIKDLHNLWRAVLKYKILSPNLTKEFLTPKVQVESGLEYGLGIYITKYQGSEMYSFVGGDAGVGFDSRYMATSGIQLSIISNITDGEEEMRKLILPLLAGIS